MMGKLEKNGKFETVSRRKQQFLFCNNGEQMVVIFGTATPLIADKTCDVCSLDVCLQRGYFNITTNVGHLEQGRFCPRMF